MKQTSYNELSDIQKRLVDKAEEAMENAYTPYYRFYVGAAILTSNNEIFIGANCENACGSSICAERAAIVSANSHGYRKSRSMAIIARSENSTVSEPIVPCGICRQVINEIAHISGNDIELILSNTTKDKIIITSINELLPHSFGPLDMQVDIEKYRK